MSQAITEAHELKPCPFCDGAPRIVEPHQSDRSIEGETDDEEWLSFIECDCVDMFFVKGSATSQDEARQSVVTAWNRRPALSAGQAQPVAIKPLEWSEVIGRDDQYFKGISAPGYRIDWHGYGQGEGPYKLDKHGEFDTLEAAKAAAQQDYETRIRSALVPPAVPGEVHAQLALIKHLAEYTTEKNWADKRLYIMQAVDRALSAPLPEIEGGDVWQTIDTAPESGRFLGIAVGDIERIAHDDPAAVVTVKAFKGPMICERFESEIDGDGGFLDEFGELYNSDGRVSDAEDLTADDDVLRLTFWQPLPAAPSASIGETP